MITAVIFDYGGTLVYPRDSWERIKPRAVYETYKALYDNGLKMSLEEFISFEESFFDEYSKLEAEEKMDVPDIEKYGKLVEQLFPEKSREWWESLAKTITAVFWSVVINNYDVRTDAHQTLETLRSREFKMAIISNHHNHEALVGHLKGMGLDGFFFPIISSCQFPFKKPDSRIFNRP
jgi:FMN phosphatase YigB (HAD superfamily)